MKRIKSRRKTVSMEDISRMAKVSVAAVSGVLAENSRICVSDETRKRILAVASKAGYVYSKKNNHRDTEPLSVLVLARYGLDNPMAREIIRGIEQALNASKGRMIFSMQDNNDTESLLQNFPGLDGIHGAIFLSRINQTISEHLASRGIPYIVIGSSVKYRDLDMVYIDPIDYADRAAEYLVSLGHRRVCSFFASPHYNYEVVSARFENEIRRLTGEKPLSLFYHEDESPLAVLNKALSAKSRPTAIFGQMCDVFPILLSGTFSVPDDFSVLSVDSPGIVGEKPLTYVGVNNIELGLEGIHMLVHRKEAPDRQPRQVIFPVSIHDNGSCKMLI